MEASLPLKNKRGEKNGKEKENRVIDNQFDRIHPLGILFHCQSTRCPQGPMTFKHYELYKLSTKLIDPFSFEIVGLSSMKYHGKRRNNDRITL